MISIKGFKNLGGSESILSEIAKFSLKTQTTNSWIPLAGSLLTGESISGVASAQTSADWTTTNLG